MATYALINPTDDLEMIVNVIVANEIVAATYRKENSGPYDYVLDLTEVSPTPGIGWSYDPGEDLFAAPPIDYATIVRSELSDVHAILQQIMADGGNLSPEDFASALSQGVSDISGDFTENESDLVDAIVVYLSGGG